MSIVATLKREARKETMLARETRSTRVYLVTQEESDPITIVLSSSVVFQPSPYPSTSTSRVISNLHLDDKIKNALQDYFCAPDCVRIE